MLKFIKIEPVEQPVVPGTGLAQAIEMEICRIQESYMTSSFHLTISKPSLRCEGRFQYHARIVAVRDLGTKKAVVNSYMIFSEISEKEEISDDAQSINVSAESRDGEVEPSKRKRS